MTIQVIGSIFTGSDKPGDFGWMLQQSEYDDAFFIFNDNEEQFLAHRADPNSEYGCAAGGGNAVIRPYQCITPPRAAGIPTGTLATGGYPKLTTAVQQTIDDAVTAIRGLLQAHSYQRVFYSAANAKGDLGGRIFVIAPEVKAYVVSQIKTLAVSPASK